MTSPLRGIGKKDNQSDFIQCASIKTDIINEPCLSFCQAALRNYCHFIHNSLPGILACYHTRVSHFSINLRQVHNEAVTDVSSQCESNMVVDSLSSTPMISGSKA